MTVPQKDRLPPRQLLAAKGKWPVVGERLPSDIPDPWTISVSGDVQRPSQWTLAELQGLPSFEQTIDIHCVTRWSKLDVCFTGVLLQTLLAQAEPDAQARYISFRSASQRNHSTSLPLTEAIELKAMVVWEVDGEALSIPHGGPIRMVVPGKYFYKSVKWIREIELIYEDRLGFWESNAGYHNQADPWKQQRFAAADVSRAQMRRLLETRNFSGQSMLGLFASQLDLAKLQAQNAILRDGDFSESDLREADFRGANLSNSRFVRADLRGASLVQADIEGADFSGADLRGTDFTGASLLGCSFQSSSDGPSKMDAETRLEIAQTKVLADTEREFVERCLRSNS